MHTCSNASSEALLEDGHTRAVVGLGDTAATVDIDPFAWTKSEDPGGEAGRDTMPPETRERSNVKGSGERSELRLPSFDDPRLRLVPRRR